MKRSIIFTKTAREGRSAVSTQISIGFSRHLDSQQAAREAAMQAKTGLRAAAIEISDTGISVSKTDLNKLFNEFYLVDNEINQNVKGTGLGLSLVKKIVDAHKGKIRVTSELNQGTTFHFTLPFNSATPATA